MSVRTLCHSLVPCGIVLLAASRAGAAPGETFRIAGAIASPQVWSAALIRQKMPADVQTVAYTLRGQRHTARAVSLWALLDAPQPRLNPRIKHHVLQFVVAAQGQDGYTADFTLGELSPDFGGRAVWVALDEDGKTLTGDAGPVQLLVPDDKKPARWVHAVRLLTVTDGAQAAPSTAPTGT